MTLNELAMKAKKCCNFEFQQGSHTLTDGFNEVIIISRQEVIKRPHKGNIPVI